MSSTSTPAQPKNIYRVRERTEEVVWNLISIAVNTSYTGRPVNDASWESISALCKSVWIHGGKVCCTVSVYLRVHLLVLCMSMSPCILCLSNLCPSYAISYLSFLFLSSLPFSLLLCPCLSLPLSVCFSLSLLPPHLSHASFRPLTRTRASSSDCTKKASQQDRFPRIGLIVTSSQSQNREKTIASWTDTVSSQCRTQRESWWNGLWPGSLLRT